MIQNDLFLRAHRGEAIERYPVWLMRQAGRILPEYRAVRAKLSGFKELVETPEFATEVTIQPVDLLGVDAAIIFSDILVIPEAMGLPYQMIEQKGPWFENTIRTQAQLDQLDAVVDVQDRLWYVFEALKQTKAGLGGRVPLIGFAGAPWTILCYMVEGHGSKTFSESRKLLYTQPLLAHQLLQRITDVTIAYLKGQIAAGADALQLFDSWAGILGEDQYREFGLRYIQQICAALQEVPLTVFSKGAIASLPEIAQLPCTTIGLDWNMSVPVARSLVQEQKTLQGNLDPCVLYGSAQLIEQETKKMLNSFKSQRHIVNLGHGVYPDIDPEMVKVFINTVKNYEITNHANS
ncbi:MAG: uroporphyrinogen decarboxylase [Crocinitomicaceae bacterium]|jgi:uroporphyrinogen decarboxylase|nr:uroporphyrinogen decarboxylase [Crocinitomicaceae bacterium]MDP4740069.1 uroporphyrinogen decarboxylase [Crocinitomicaceae bacterium]MDP4799898.1 uroporphyrinogen decarboxylase [Crocinitomicaceae bacterium]MDP5042961.1 uroporphyrinogen decarboxylase [Crocinitomicaceae bacterium]MDP5065913.1 uroporphyrinogen decarboxylase [Crocinitomicaceae bacterium]